MEELKFKQIVVAQKEVFDDDSKSGKILSYDLYGLTEEGEVMQLIDLWDTPEWVPAIAPES